MSLYQSYTFICAGFLHDICLPYISPFKELSESK